MPETLIAVFGLVMAIGIAGIWTLDIVRSPEIDRSAGLVRARDPSNGTLFLPHWIAEYGTSVALLVGGVALLAEATWAPPLMLAGLGALVYTSTNSLGWALARSERRPYAVPMLVGAVGGVVSIAALLIA